MPQKSSHYVKQFIDNEAVVDNDDDDEEEEEEEDGLYCRHQIVEL